jgi:hypothetical protein
MTPEDETYIHLDECIRSLNEAWHVAQEVRRTAQKSAITAAAYRYALVAYARPYTDSDGIHRNRKNRDAYKRKPPQLLAIEEIALHDEILRLRNKILAHSDLTVKDAKLYVGRYGSQSKAVIGSNIQPSLPDVSAVIRLIEHSLDALYAERTEREEEFGKA